MRRNEPDEKPGGEAKISGKEILVPATRQIRVARAYVAGLERDRDHLRELEANYDRTVWDTIQVASYAKALYVALHSLREGFHTGLITTELLDRVDILLETDRHLFGDIWSCPCGHSKFDHDEHGCQYLGCKPICGS